MKILFTMGSPEYLRYYDETIRLLAGRGHTVAIAVNAQKDGKPVRLDGIAGQTDRIVSLGVVPRRRDVWADLAKVVRGSMDFVRYLHPRFADAPVLRERMKRKALPPALHFLDRFGSLSETKVGWLLRGFGAIERAIPSSRDLEQFIREQNPDVVLVSPLVDAASDQVDMVKSARAAGIPTAACIASWDNLTNKGLLRVRTDRIFLWNEMQKAEAVSLHGARPDSVVVTGAQPFDRWFGKHPERSRRTFCDRVGLRDDAPFLLFVGSSMFISAAAAEVDFVRQWVRAIRNSADPDIRTLPILIRPHPYNGGEWAGVDMSQFGNVAIWPRGRHNPVDEANREDYFESLYYSLAVVGINTSAMIEATIVGRPVHSIVTSAFARTQEGTLHFHYLLPENGGFLRVASSLEEHVEKLADTIRNKETARQEVDRFVRSFLRPQGLETASAGLLADAIESLGSVPVRAERPSAAHALFTFLLYPLTPLATLARAKRRPRQVIDIYLRKPLRQALRSGRRTGRRLLKRAARNSRASETSSSAVARTNRMNPAEPDPLPRQARRDP